MFIVHVLCINGFTSRHVHHVLRVRYQQVQMTHLATSVFHGHREAEMGEKDGHCTAHIHMFHYRQ